ncbi:transporter substrate-binding domain-containing protein [uncultured Shewanella sp.]|uniref:substrate-binding periplasmic protein n=1 Tax=uncultured Shewanella sp. TaxID=173975 RepID=UPI0026129BA3|nr:transporter substrate-binding domain-containing protein [uncultured Shewanella sp.]
MWLKTLLSLMLTLTLTLLSGNQAGADELTYLVISDQAEPFQIVDHDVSQADPEHKGIISDIIYASLKESEVKLTTLAYPFKRYILMMAPKQTPRWISYGSPAWLTAHGEEAQNKRLSKNKLFDVSHVLVTKKDSAFTVNRVNDLFGKTIITLKGFTYPGLDRYIKAGLVFKVEVNSHESALKAVETGRGIGFVAMKCRALYTINNTELDRNDFTLVDFAKVIAPYPIHISFSDAVPEQLIEQVDQKILKLKQSHRIDEIIRAYIGE